MSIKTKWGVLSTLIYQMELHEYLMDFKEYINTHLNLNRLPRILDNIISASRITPTNGIYDIITE